MKPEESEISSVPWHALTPDEVLKTLQTSLENGLTEEEAAARLEKYGQNKLAEAPPTSFWKMLWDQFNDFVIMLLIAAAIISAFLGEWIESGAIMAIVILNAVLGIVQQQRAEQALAALRQMAAPEASVLRGGHRKVLPARDLVPGDIVLLEAGNYIPADMRLLQAVNLKVEEAALTGESVPVQKVDDRQLPEDASLGDRKNSAFMSTLVSYGRGTGVVTSTGMQTQIGHIASMIQAWRKSRPAAEAPGRAGKQLGWAALASRWCSCLGSGGRDVLEMFSPPSAWLAPCRKACCRVTISLRWHAQDGDATPDSPPVSVNAGAPEP